MNNIKLSVVIPSYNEEINLNKGVLEEVEKYFKGVKYLYEVIIVDDGSTDGSVPLIGKIVSRNNNFRLIEKEHGGKAAAVMTGLLESKGEIGLFTDMDQATPISEIRKLIPKFEQGYDIVFGSRHGREGAPFLRKLAAWGFAVIRNILLGLPFKDTQCGFKAFNRNAIDSIFPKIKNEWGVVHFRGGAVNAGFDVEVLYLAKKLGFQIAEVEVRWSYVDTERVQVVKDSAAAIYDMLRIRWSDLLGKYKV